MIVLAFDPGLTGAVCMLDHRGILALRDLPTMAIGSGKGAVKNQINAAVLHALLSQWIQEHHKEDIHACIEITHAMPYRPGQKDGPRQGSSGIYSMGHTAGIIEGVAVAHHLPITKAEPSKWKRKMGLGRDKEVARARATHLFPESADQFARVKDHNRAEAALLALWCHQEKTGTPPAPGQDPF